MKLTLTAIVLAMSVSGALARDRTEIVQELGEMTIARHLCEIDLDMQLFGALVDRLRDPDDRSFKVDIYHANRQVSREFGGWSPAKQRSWCEGASERIASLGLLRR